MAYIVDGSPVSVTKGGFSFPFLPGFIFSFFLILFMSFMSFNPFNFILGTAPGRPQAPGAFIFHRATRDLSEFTLCISFIPFNLFDLFSGVAAERRQGRMGSRNHSFHKVLKDFQHFRGLAARGCLGALREPLGGWVPPENLPPPSLR